MNILLPRGLVAIIDDADAWVLEGPVWTFNGLYVSRQLRTSEGVRGEYLHRKILGLTEGDGVRGDHRSGDTLDNRRSNLRAATHRQNIRNRKRNTNNTSGFKGVSWHRQSGKWVARIRTEEKYASLGLYPTKELAHQAYCTAAAKLFGEFARVA